MGGPLPRLSGGGGGLACEPGYGDDADCEIDIRAEDGGPVKGKCG